MTPCPFCGGEPQARIRDLHKPFSVECKGCGAESAQQATQESAWKCWNRRTTPMQQVHPDFEVRR